MKNKFKYEENVPEEILEETPLSELWKTKENGADTYKDIQNQVAKNLNLAGTKLGNIFQNTNWKTTAANGLNLVSGGIQSVFGSNTDTTSIQKLSKSTITSGISKLDPVVGGVVGLVDSIGDAAKWNMDSMNSDQKNFANLTGFQKFTNNLVGSIPVLSTLAGAIAGDTINAYNTKEAKSLTAAMGDTMNDASIAATMGGKSYLYNGQINNKIAKSNNDVITLTNLARTNSQKKNAALQFAQNLDNINDKIYSGFTSNSITVGKNGLKLISVQEANEILAHKKFLDNIVSSFQNGGVIGVDTNILPEGALHRELNNLEEINPEVGEEVTNKGIPVITTDSNGEIEQVAEIEKEEIILRKEITKKIEELWKDGSEDAMIEAGRILSEEIITNTQDNTGQLENE